MHNNIYFHNLIWSTGIDIFVLQFKKLYIYLSVYELLRYNCIKSSACIKLHIGYIIFLSTFNYTLRNSRIANTLFYTPLFLLIYIIFFPFWSFKQSTVSSFFFREFPSTIWLSPSISIDSKCRWKISSLMGFSFCCCRMGNRSSSPPWSSLIPGA